MFCCLSPKAYLNRFELLSLLRMKVFFPFKLQIDLIFISFIQDARRNDAMKNKERYFLYLYLFLFFAVCVPDTGLAGFEPTNTGVKVLCLTAWRQPYVVASTSISLLCPCYIVYYTHLKTTVNIYF